MEIKSIVTMPPYAPYIEEVLEHRAVSGIRLNTVMPLKESYWEVVKRLYETTNKYKKLLWIDLKCRQLRIKNFGTPPFTEIELSHEISVYTPTKAYFSNRSESATILEVEGNKLIMQDGPRRVVGPGESVTIPHPTLKIKGYLTVTDKKYLEAGNSLGFHNYMASFVESQSDIEEILSLDNKANLIAKIESQKGLDYVKHKYVSTPRLMAARGDLYMELHYPHTMIDALELIANKDPNAIAASRILSLMVDRPEPTSEDLFDLDNLLRIGYKTLMFGDEVCLKRESIVSALNVFHALAEKYGREK